MADESKLKELKAEWAALEKELTQITGSMKRKISKKKAEVVAENTRYLNEVGAEYMVGKTPFWAGGDLVGIKEGRHLEMHRRDLIMLTSMTPRIADNNGHKYVVYDCITVNGGWGHEGKALSISIATIGMQSLKTDGLHNITQAEWKALYNNLQQQVMGNIMAAVKDSPELMLQPMLLLPSKPSKP